MRITMIGAGNIAWNLALAFERTDHNIEKVYSRHFKNAEALAKKLFTAEATDQFDFSDSKADVFIIALKDDLIEFAVEAMKIPESSIVVHTSGSCGLEVLQRIPNPKGVFYPLQTFSKEKVADLKNVPVCIEAESKNTEKILRKMAFSISEHVCLVDSQDRKYLHLAAVFACNFTNHMYHIASDILQKEGLDFNILKALIRETTDKALKYGPEKSQTGPAIRDDNNILSTHMDMLREEPSLQKMYEMISDNIYKWNKDKEDDH